MLQQQSIFNTDNRTACTAWEYDMNDNVGNSWTSQWDLVCDKEYLKNVAEMFFLLGVATGGIISGYLSDKFGRKTMLFISAVLQTIFGMYHFAIGIQKKIVKLLIVPLVFNYILTTRTSQQHVYNKYITHKRRQCIL